MGNHPSAVVDDGQSPVNKQAYTVQGNLHARAVMASTVNAKAIYARSITCQHAQIAQHQTLQRNNYPNPPHRNITAHTVNADIIYADEINCKTLRCYEVYVGDGEQWRAKRVEHIDRNRVTWNGREDVDSEASDDDDDDQAGQRSKRKKAIAIGLGGALAAGLGGAAIAFFKHKHDEKDEKEAKEKEERERKEKEEREKKEKSDRDKKEKDDLRKRQEDDDRRRREDEDRRRKDDEYRNERDKRDEDDRRRRDEEDRRRREEDERRRHDQHHVLPPSNNNNNNNNNNQHHGGGGGGGVPFHQSSRNVRLWSDGNHCFLIADCDAGNGNFQESRIDLDQLVAARNGEFYWVRRGESGNFSGQAQHWEIMANQSTMAAQLPQHDGSLQRRQLDLSQFIVNRNGHLSYTNN